MHMHLLRPQDPSLALLIPTSVRVMQSAPSPSHSVQITVMIAAQSVTMSRGVLQTLVKCHQPRDGERGGTVRHCGARALTLLTLVIFGQNISHLFSVNCFSHWKMSRHTPSDDHSTNTSLTPHSTQLAWFLLLRSLSMGCPKHSWGEMNALKDGLFWWYLFLLNINICRADCS